MVALASSYVRADASGLRIRNGLRVHAVPWDRVHKIILRPGDPWALLLITPEDGRPFEADIDAEKRQLMGIQSGGWPTCEGCGERAPRTPPPLPASPLTTPNSQSLSTTSGAETLTSRRYSMPRDLRSASISAISSSIGGCTPPRLPGSLLGW